MALRRYSFSNTTISSGDNVQPWGNAASAPRLLVTLRMTVESDLRAGRLVQVLEPYSASPLGIYAIFAERGRPTSAARALVDHLARALGEPAVAR
jgi:DNA-binding transcriptional LysR family regulator